MPKARCNYSTRSSDRGERWPGVCRRDWPEAIEIVNPGPRPGRAGEEGRCPGGGTLLADGSDGVGGIEAGMEGEAEKM